MEVNNYNDDYRNMILKESKMWNIITIVLVILGFILAAMAHSGIITSPAIIFGIVTSFLGAFFTVSKASDKIDLVLKIDEKILETRLEEEYKKRQEKSHVRDTSIHMIQDRESENDIVQSIPTRDEERADFSMGLSDFYEIEEFNIGRINLDQIDEYLLLHRIDLTELCRLINLSREETMLVYLEYAKRYYMQGDMTLGDRFLDEVDECNDKTDYVKYVIQELKSKRKFYKHRNDGNIKTLSLEKRFKTNSLKNSEEGMKF